MRVAGSGHSFTGAVLTGDTLLSLERMNRVLDADPESGLVRVEAGIGLHQLTRELHFRGLALRTSGTSTRSRWRARSPPARTAPARGCAT